MSELSGLRIAVLHEWFAAIGGSEQVALELARVLNADLWALWDDAPDAPGRRPLQSRLASAPSWLRRRALAMPLTPAIWRRTRAPRYDVVVTSSHGLGHSARLPGSPDAVYLSYVHTPARYLWSPELDRRGAAWYLAPARSALKRIDTRTSRHVRGYAANSAEVRGRIRRYWGRDACVIPPPVDTDFYHPVPVDEQALPPGLAPGRFLLAAGRWVPYKRFPAAVDVASRSGIPLVIAGGGPDAPRVRERIATASVPVLEVADPSRGTLRQLYSAAGALIFPGREDFGMVPVEAQACGTPVVALDLGGARETVEPGVTGYLVPNDLDAFGAAALRALDLDRGHIRDHALLFSYAEFDRRVTTWVQEALS